ncbi:type IV secretion system protein VirB3 [Altererythrobacter lutimaris]|uniref:VirB3 family type IV secretion system protein n=1 Tax=Altererythrobacter lutimaris TaxID=2743979 RepID=A0A850HCA1_9SPHN|nr:VirB3 family type IV secretion system protein [Altererythrobacter lutimaris]
MSALVRHPVHRALTRPQMFAGVTMNFFIINLMVTTIAFLMIKSFWIIPVPIITHIIGYFVSLREPRILDLWITKVSMCPRVPNYQHWGCNSYAP